MTTLKRLVNYPHAAVFDKSAQDEILFRLSHPDRATWEVSEAFLHVNAGLNSTSYDLSLLTVGQLILALVSDGYSVTENSSAHANLSALVLTESAGDEGISNGNRVTGYTSLMWVLMGGYAVVIREAGLQVIQALRQMIITQAEGEWLDLWGRLYGVSRRLNEIDSAYAARIPKEAFRLRESVVAIEEAVFDETGYVIRIEEPWRNIFRLDHSLLSGEDKFQDGERIGYFYIQPTSKFPIDWSVVLPIIHRNRAAGIVVLPPFSRNLSYVNAGINPMVEGVNASINSSYSLYEDRTLLDYSNIEDVPILNHASIRSKTVRHTSWSTTFTGWRDSVWTDDFWTDSSYIVSGKFERKYRVYISLVNYESTDWADIVWPNDTWKDFNVSVISAHTRS